MNLYSDYLEMYLLHPVLHVKIVSPIKLAFSSRSCKIPNALTCFLEAKETIIHICSIIRTVFIKRLVFMFRSKKHEFLPVYNNRQHFLICSDDAVLVQYHSLGF